jgi:putative aldouronate transport system substrate-binding protein
LLVALLLPSRWSPKLERECLGKIAVEYTPVGTFPIVKTPITVDIMVAQPPCVEDFNTNRFTK